MIKKLAITGLVSASLAFGASTTATASEISGSVVVDEATTIVRTEVQGEVEIPSSRQPISHGNLRGTWTYGNTGVLGFGRVWSSVTGNSSGTGRASGRATVRNGQGHERTGGWRAPGINSRAEIDRTNSGTNSAFWSLGNP